MADTTIFGLTATTTLAAGDAVPVVDVSDTTQSVNGSTRKTTLATLKTFVNTDPVLTGAQTITASAMAALAIDVTELRNTKTLAGDTTFTFSGTPGEGQEFGVEITGHTAAVTVTIPSSRNVDTNEDITTFVMPANGYAVLVWRRKGSVNLLTGVPVLRVVVADVALTDGANISLNAALGNNFYVVLGGNRTLDNPTNAVSGQVINVRIRQDATGSRTLAYGTKYLFPGGTDPVLTTTASAVDFMSCKYDAVLDAWLCNMTKAYA